MTARVKYLRITDAQRLDRLDGVLVAIFRGWSAGERAARLLHAGETVRIGRAEIGTHSQTGRGCERETCAFVSHGSAKPLIRNGNLAICNRIETLGAARKGGLRAHARPPLRAAGHPPERRPARRHRPRHGNSGPLALKASCRKSGSVERVEGPEGSRAAGAGQGAAA